MSQMKSLKYLAVALLVALATGAEAKDIQVPHLYMFGFSASFQDSTLYFTDIQDIPGAWIDKKTKFLKERENYSYQLKNYLTEQGQPNRVCMVIFSTKKAKAEKKYNKLLKRYSSNTKKKKKNKKKHAVSTAFDIKYISQDEFKFERVDIQEEEQPQQSQPQQQ